MSKLPFEGLRVLDLTVIWAGPYAARILSDMGAEVIKIENIESRSVGTSAASGAVSPEGEQRPYVRDSYFINYNAGKRTLALNLGRPEGADVFRKLVKISDVVIENYSPRVMRRFGLSYECIREVNPQIIMISMPAFGMTGPESGYMGYGIGIEQLSGYVALTGYSEEETHKSGINYGDPVAGLHGAAAVLAALYYRLETGKGQHIDLSQRESAIALIGDAVLDYSMNQRVQRPLGNRHNSMAPHGCYRCQGEDKWVTIAVRNDEDWRCLCRAIGKPELVEDSRFGDAIGRLRDQDELDAILEAWTSERGHYEVMEILQEAGVPAGAVLDVKELLVDPQIAHRGAFQHIPYPDGFTYPIPAIPWRLQGLPIEIGGAAPDFGEHNDWVLGEILGMSAAEINELLEKQAIAKVPVPRTRP